jgi:hypothetical protein
MNPCLIEMLGIVDSFNKKLQLLCHRLALYNKTLSGCIFVS